MGWKETMELQTLDIKQQRTMNLERWKTKEGSSLVPPVVPAYTLEKVSKPQYRKEELSQNPRVYLS